MYLNFNICMLQSLINCLNELYTVRYLILKIKLILEFFSEYVEYSLKRFFIFHAGIRLFVLAVGFINLKNHNLTGIIRLVFWQKDDVFFAIVFYQIENFK